MSRPQLHRVAGFVAIGGFLLAALLSLVLLVRSSGVGPLTWIELVSALVAAGVVFAVWRHSGGSR